MSTEGNLLDPILARLPPEERAQAAANFARVLRAYLQGGEEAAGAAIRQVFAEAGKREEGRGKR